MNDAKEGKANAPAAEVRLSRNETTIDTDLQGRETTPVGLTADSSIVPQFSFN